MGIGRPTGSAKTGLICASLEVDHAYTASRSFTEMSGSPLAVHLIICGTDEGTQKAIEGVVLFPDLFWRQDAEVLHSQSLPRMIAGCQLHL